MKLCKKCHNKIPWRFVDPASGRKILSTHRKYCFVCSPPGKHNTVKLELPQRKNTHIGLKTTYKCSKCQLSLDISDFFVKKSGYPFCYCKSCWNKLISQRQKEKKTKLIGLMGGKCERCGYNKCEGALEFHHKDPKEKEFNISIKNLGMKKMIDEIHKCSLLCSNCHREIHETIVSSILTSPTILTAEKGEK